MAAFRRTRRTPAGRWASRPGSVASVVVGEPDCDKRLDDVTDRSGRVDLVRAGCPQPRLHRVEMVDDELSLAWRLAVVVRRPLLYAVEDDLRRGAQRARPRRTGRRSSPGSTHSPRRTASAGRRSPGAPTSDPPARPVPRRATRSSRGRPCRRRGTRVGRAPRAPSTCPCPTCRSPGPSARVDGSQCGACVREPLGSRDRGRASSLHCLDGARGRDRGASDRKTTLFNALTCAGAEITAYASVTDKANVGMATIADDRLERLAELVSAPKVTRPRSAWSTSRERGRSSSATCARSTRSSRSRRVG